MARKKSKNPVGRPKKKYGMETLLDRKNSFKLNNYNVVLDKYIDALIVMFTMLFVACLVLIIKG